VNVSSPIRIVEPSGIVEAEHSLCDLFGDQANLTAIFHVRGVEIPSARDDQPANRLIPFGDADEIYGPLATADHHGHVQFARAGNFVTPGTVAFSASMSPTVSS